jgi:uncharacterized protein YbbK (DUF523 family)
MDTSTAPPFFTGFDWARARAATTEDPLRVLVSACLVGTPVGWDGVAYTEDVIVALTKLPNVRAVTFCPEAFELTVPRPFTTIHDGNGFDVLDRRARVLETTGRDVTRELVNGAEAMLARAREERVDLALLNEISDSCGTSTIYLGDPAKKVYQRGPGVAAATLHRAGIPVLGSRDLRTLHALFRALDPEHAMPEGVIDHVESEWYRGYFGAGT